jgi:hypothetical protein
MKANLSLSETEWTEAQKFVRQGKANARTLTRASTSLKLADGWDEAELSRHLNVVETERNEHRRHCLAVHLTECTPETRAALSG